MEFLVWHINPPAHPKKLSYLPEHPNTKEIRFSLQAIPGINQSYKSMNQRTAANILHKSTNLIRKIVEKKTETAIS